MNHLAPFRVPLRFLLLALIWASACIPLARAEIDQETLQRRILDLHHDRVAGNCMAAMTFLGAHSGEKQVQTALLKELYATHDLQSKEECMVLLCSAPDFEPDETFAQELLKRMHHYGKPSVLGSGKPAGNAGAVFLAKHAAKFEALLAAELTEKFQPEDNSLWMQYVVIRALAKGRLLNKYADRFTPAYLERLTENLQDDQVEHNAAQSTLALVFLGKLSVDALHKAAQKSNLQGRQFSLAILAYVTGKISLDKFHEQIAVSQELFQFDSDDLDPKRMSNTDVHD